MKKEVGINVVLQNLGTINIRNEEETIKDEINES